MKKVLFAAGISIIALSAAFAQEVKKNEPNVTVGQTVGVSRTEAIPRKLTPEAAAQRKTDRLDQQLTLTADQKKKVYDVFLKHGQETNGRLAPNPELDQDIKGLLTAEQNTKYDAMRAERQQVIEKRAGASRSSELKSPTPIK